MTKIETKKLLNEYASEYIHSTDYEHRYDIESSRLAYSLIRYFRPRKCLEIGTWYGGSTSMIMQALLRNGGWFKFIASEVLEDMRETTLVNVKKETGRKPKIIGDITQEFDLSYKEIDFLFVDTDHDLKTTKWIFKNVFPNLKKGALVAIHDWAVKEENGKWIGKGLNGVGGWKETNYLMRLHRRGKLPLEKLYWNYEEGEGREASFWKYTK